MGISGRACRGSVGWVSFAQCIADKLDRCPSCIGKIDSHGSFSPDEGFLLVSVQGTVCGKDGEQVPGATSSENFSDSVCGRRAAGVIHPPEESTLESNLQKNWG